MKTILITGTNRGIGLGLVKYLAQQRNRPDSIIATCRSPDKAEALQEISKQCPNVHILKLDVNDFDHYEKFTKDVDSIVKTNGLNVLLNNAGVTTKFTRVNLVKTEQMMENFQVNTLAPLMLTKALLPLLKQASKNNASLPFGASRAAVINISSIMGSIAENQQGGFYPYRASKAALNAITKSLSIDLKDDGILVASIHPGWLKTDMGGKSAPLTVDEVMETFFNTIQGFGQKESGRFIQYDGKELPW